MDEKIEMKPEERIYEQPPHPEAVVASEEPTAPPEAPITAEHTLDDLIKMAVDGLRGELMADLRFEMRTELQKEIRGIESNVKN